MSDTTSIVYILHSTRALMTRFLHKHFIIFYKICFIK